MANEPQIERVHGAPILAIYATRLGFIVDCRICGRQQLTDCEPDCDDQWRCASITAYAIHDSCAAQAFARQIAGLN